MIPANPLTPTHNQNTEIRNTTKLPNNAPKICPATITNHARHANPTANEKITNAPKLLDMFKTRVKATASRNPILRIPVNTHKKNVPAPGPKIPS